MSKGHNRLLNQNESTILYKIVAIFVTEAREDITKIWYRLTVILNENNYYETTKTRFNVNEVKVKQSNVNTTNRYIET